MDVISAELEAVVPVYPVQGVGELPTALIGISPAQKELRCADLEEAGQIYGVLTRLLVSYAVGAWLVSYSKSRPYM
jgi:hypothetical protein